MQTDMDNSDYDFPEYYDYEEETMSFKAWYSIHKSAHYSDNPFYHHFIFDVQEQAMDELRPALLKLLKKHYPSLKTEVRPAVLAEFDEITDYVADDLLYKLYGILNDEMQGVDFREKYPKFDTWFDFYCKPPKPKTAKEKHRKWRPDLNDEQWEEYKRKENEAFLQFFLWEQNRIKEFTELVREPLFRYFPELMDLSSDGWVLYAVNVRDAHTNFESLGENMETFIEYGFPEEYLKLPTNDFYEKMRETPEEVRKRSQELRNRRIAGEDV